MVALIVPSLLFFFGWIISIWRGAKEQEEEKKKVKEGKGNWVEFDQLEIKFDWERSTHTQQNTKIQTKKLNPD